MVNKIGVMKWRSRKIETKIVSKDAFPLKIQRRESFGILQKKKNFEKKIRIVLILKKESYLVPHSAQPWIQNIY